MGLKDVDMGPRRGLSGKSLDAIAEAAPAMDADDWTNQEGARLSGSQGFAEAQSQGQLPDPVAEAAKPASPQEASEMQQIIEDSQRQFERESKYPVRCAIGRKLGELLANIDSAQKRLDPKNEYTWYLVRQLQEWTIEVGLYRKVLDLLDTHDVETME